MLTNFPYREIAHTHRILEEPLEAGGPAGHALLWDPSMAAPSWKTAIAVQAALAAASLQLDSTVICKTRSALSVWSSYLLNNEQTRMTENTFSL